MLAAPFWGRAMLLFSIASAFLLAPTPLRAEAAAPANNFWLGVDELLKGSALGLVAEQSVLTLAADAPSAGIYQPHARFGVAESASYSLGAPSSLQRLVAHADVPPGADVLIEARSQSGDRWSTWEPPDALGNLDGVHDLQVRLTLLSSPEGMSPHVYGVLGTAQVAVAAAMAVEQGQFGPPTATVWATREGLVGQTTANGHVIVERDRFVALPSRRALNALGRRDYMVRIEYKGRVTEAPVWDIGPWNIRDDYWNERRETFTDLPRWTPEAEAAFFRDYNGGRDGFGRFVTIPPSIDLADGTFWDDLRMGANDWVKVTFLWLDAPSPPARTTPLVVPRVAPNTEPSAPVASAPAPPAASSKSVLSASPNPAPAGAGSGTTTVSWDTGDGTFGQVYVWQTGGGETLFAHGISGRADASWIKNGWSYELRLYQGTSKGKRLRTITVTGNSARAGAPVPVAPPAASPPIVVEPPILVGGPEAPKPPAAVGGPEPAPVAISLPAEPAPLAAPSLSSEILLPQSFMDLSWIAAGPGLTGGTTISWNTGSRRMGQIYVWQPGGGEVLFAQGANGSMEAPWIQNGWNYEFRLYQGLNRAERLQTVALNGQVARAIRVPYGEPQPGLEANVSTEGSGLTTIAWDTGSGDIGQIYWALDDGEEELFAQGAVGTREVPRMAPGRTYSFRLYAGTDHTTLLASVAAMGPTQPDLMAETATEPADAEA